MQDRSERANTMMEMSDRTTAMPSDLDLDTHAWLAPERMAMGLLCFLIFICASVAGLLLAAA